MKKITLLLITGLLMSCSSDDSDGMCDYRLVKVNIPEEENEDIWYNYLSCIDYDDIACGQNYADSDGNVHVKCE